MEALELYQSKTLVNFNFFLLRTLKFTKTKIFFVELN